MDWFAVALRMLLIPEVSCKEGAVPPDVFILCGSFRIVSLSDTTLCGKVG
jgi:hypothetical protein